MGVHKAIEMYALQNAVHHGGKANPKAVLGKILGQFPDEKKRVAELMKQINELTESINALSDKDQKSRLEKLAPELLEKKKGEKREGLKPLPDAEHKKVVLRLEPSPSGGLHIGHSVPLLINSYYKKQYDGRFIIRISDTNPSNIAPESYELIENDSKWITQNNVTDVVIQSDRMNIYYDYGLQLIEKGHAYVCCCDPEDYKSSMSKMIPCPCRDQGVNKNTKLWHDMHTIMPEGEAVVRLKTDIRHKNPALRDFALFRINSSNHPRTGNMYRVWPMMNMAVAVDDHDLGLTHVIRGKDHMDNTRRQEYIFDYFGWKKPNYLYVGMVNFKGLQLSASGANKDIQDKIFDGWDDVRLPFLTALKRRGYQPQAFEKFVVSLGITQVDKTVDAKEFFKTLNFYNKEIIDPISNRYFFVENPKEILVQGTPSFDVELDLHPDNKKGGRKISITDRFLVQASDLESLEYSTVYRLMNCLNMVKEKDGFKFKSKGVDDYKGDGIMHWLANGETLVDVELLMDDNSLKVGKGESAMKNIKVGDIVQLERVCFARLDSIEDNILRFVYLHK